ncbi:MULTISPECIES: NAD(P)H-dependent oxidoreductase [unclassified Arcicella]|uniref:FMN-dependent NADH-azoreductase n=1 Tax=unclassified Arcicella TaxID=2644986 RepID=UPI002860BBD3|nr:MULTISPECIES: NAD(P)H-dependent oxidoreductase [unclassified Arcicella]MDR6563189.1 FMN-dependent NADH-azoreductase [Arcicella sp. BE51]MDR6811660.1 FMN-dependent NADH-azoreductase [Arcicella sp. BE140]MDR6823185.1 FMN-dependent NADH-azoreductase [Arcicella sp. BE139]
MKRILHLKSSLLGKESCSIKLGNAIVEKIQEKYPDNELEELNLVDIEMPHLTPTTLRTFFIPNDQLNEEEQEAISLSDRLVKQLFGADIIVIGAPLINFTIHTSLKAWIDHVTRPAITFGYGEDGRPIGMITEKKVYVAMSSGGIYSEGAGKANDFVAPYLKAFLGFLGMTDLTVFRAEGLKVPNVKEYAMAKAIESIKIN